MVLQPDELLEAYPKDPEEDTVMNIGGLCGEIQRRMGETKGFEICLRVILGNFAFQKMAMVKDLRERGQELAAHDVVAAIAGDSGANHADPKQFDSVPPENEFLVLDADSSQQQAIAAVLSGQSRVIHGPLAVIVFWRALNLFCLFSTGTKPIVRVSNVSRWSFEQASNSAHGYVTSPTFPRLV